MKTDTELQKDVMDELKWEPSVTAAEIGVSAANGVVTLNGNADLRQEMGRRTGGSAGGRRQGDRR